MTLGDLVRRGVPCLQADDHVGPAVSRVRESGLPALPVLDDERLLGVFGEREFIEALFPGYVGTLGSASFVTRSIDDVIEKRAGSAALPIRAHVTTDHVDVGPDFSDLQLAEIFLHHRVLVVPVTEDGRVVGVVTRADFFAALAERYAELT